MPVSNKRGPFKGKTARLLAEKHELSPLAWSRDSDNGKFITLEDVQWLIDNINYDLNGKALYNNNNVPKQKRYDNTCPFNEAYTINEFNDFYGESYLSHWHKSKIYIPSVIEYSN